LLLGFYSEPWWKLDLMTTYSVNRVNITNRHDCCSDRINGAEIRIGNVSSNVLSNPVCAVVSTIPAGATYSYPCHGMKGRYVTVNIPGPLQKYLTLCEVEVYGEGVLKQADLVFWENNGVTIVGLGCMLSAFSNLLHKMHLCLKR
uniref:Fucolectin tachylectin-4 pentraxin-1 domain-containing protein n=1 Tax=Cyprinus carpio carpio TaxID=630221 RepID=A0A9J8AM11_CYPCA